MKNIKKKNARKKPEIDYTVVLLEDMRGEFKAVAEGQSMLFDKFEEFKEETRSNFKEVFRRLDKLEAFEEEAKDNFEKVFEYLSRIEDEVIEIKESLVKLEKEKANWSIVRELTKRVEKIEKELAWQKSALKVK